MKKAVIASCLAFCSIVAGCDSEIKVSQSKDCWIDGINANPSDLVRVQKSLVNFTGWAVDSSKSISPESVAVQLMDKKGLVILSKRSNSLSSRKDIAITLNESAYDRVGFSIDLDLTGLDSEEYAISLAVHAEDRVLLCPINKKIYVE